MEVSVLQTLASCIERKNKSNAEKKREKEENWHLGRMAISSNVKIFLHT